ncbi:ABC transporter permease [Streptomyces sp. KM273126]|uniref:ABC transporter permease n=1 Tax=Streptomyces sp. KM273126 TaxID=2545247 RepID=UPI00103CE324|nr:ABC transporter permease [Streptomyces sp. KM273126]MBA2806180.1 ABC transporter permease [Streptomyces sp. KM273126]
MRSDLRTAWLLTRGSGRREWWRVALTAVGAGLATAFTLGATVLASASGRYRVPLAAGLLDDPGTRSGVMLGLTLLLVPVLGFLGQCARIGAVHRDRRLAGLRLAGATAGQVRRIAALESGLACLVGSAVATALFVRFLLRLTEDPPGFVWAGIALVAVAVPVLGALVSALALRRVVASPLGWVRRVRPAARRGRGAGFLVALGVLAAGLALVPDAFGRYAPVTVVVVVVILTGVGAVWLTGVISRLTGRLLAARTGSPAVLIAAERLRDAPWTTARTHATVLLVTVVGTGFVGVRHALLSDLNAREPSTLAVDQSFYTTGIDLAGAAVLVALAITLSGLAVGAAESLATRRRGLAAQTAAGVPRAVLGRALLLETALPLAPALLLASVGGMTIGVWYGALVGGSDWSVPYEALLVPVAVYVLCLLAAATALPLLRRTLRPAELRYA